MTTMLLTIESVGLSRVALEHVEPITTAFRALQDALARAGFEDRGDGLRLSELTADVREDA